MNPGDVLTCTRCDTRSEPLHTTGGRRFEEGGVLIATWTNYSYPRHDVVQGEVHAALCLPCDDECLGFRDPRSDCEGRPAVPQGSGGRAAGVGEPVAPLERFGQLEERSAGGGPCIVGVKDRQPGEAPGTTDGFKAPLERFAPLAAAFHEETGLWPPGKDNPAGIDDEALWRRWTEWCRGRAVTQAPKPKPRGQLALF